MSSFCFCDLQAVVNFFATVSLEGFINTFVYCFYRFLFVFQMNEGDGNGGGGSYDEYGSPHSFEYDEFAPQYDPAGDPQYDLSDTVGASASAEAAMQANVTNSLFNLMSGGGHGCVANDPNTPELTPTNSTTAAGTGKKSSKQATPSTNANHSNKAEVAPTPSKQAQMNSSGRYRPSTSSTPSQSVSKGQSQSTPTGFAVYDPVMIPNENTKHHLPYTPITAHAVATSTTSASTSSATDKDTITNGVSTHKPARGVVAPCSVTDETHINDTAHSAEWRCTMCTLHNSGLTDTCESCGIMRSS